MFQKDLEKVSGEIEVATTGIQLSRLMSSWFSCVSSRLSHA